ncbi:MAG: hypothetical protein HY854_13315 [Burkholderiales bacterium]|nr:hypothetical protein [Burkholderiales bacterium]
MYEEKRTLVLRGLQSNYTAFYKGVVFAGPSLHFHLAALEASRREDVRDFATNSYAMLASWGMHRMGPKGAKMDRFDEYLASLRQIWPAVTALRQVGPAQANEDVWKKLRACFVSLKVMRSGSVLVAHSKVLAHALPKLIAPIDREYTIRFLRGHKSVPTAQDRQVRWFEEIHRHFYYPVVTDPRFNEAIMAWSKSKQPWDSSPLKVADNVVIGYVRRKRAST